MQYRIRIVSPTGMTLVDDDEISSEDFEDVLSGHLEDLDEPNMRMDIRTSN